MADMDNTKGRARSPRGTEEYLAAVTFPLACRVKVRTLLRLSNRSAFASKAGFGVAVFVLPALERRLEAAGVEPASLANLPAATTCLVRRKFSAAR